MLKNVNTKPFSLKKVEKATAWILGTSTNSKRPRSYN